MPRETKVKDWWSESEYVVVCQVTDGVPVYEVKDEAGNIKTVHHNRLFLVAIPAGAVMPLGVGTLLSEENAARSTLAELTLLEVESDLPEASMDGADTLSPTSRALLRWGRRCSMTTVISGPKTDNRVRRVRSWRWSVEPE